MTRDVRLDARGHGKSPGERGDSPSFAAGHDVDFRSPRRRAWIKTENIVLIA
jgi:alpha-beta hydrolase superfamily lysophospholipase